MRDSKERLVKNPQSFEHTKSPSFIVHRLPERNRSQTLKKYKLETEADLAVEYLPPSNGHADRERLQETILNLKVQLNSVSNENMKLRSKMMVLEKQADKLRQVADNRFEPHQKEQRELQRLCNNLKERLRERNAEYDFLDGQFQALKRSVKKTKINEMEAESQSLLAELNKMAKLYLELMAYRQQTEAERAEWKKSQDALKERSNYAKLLEQQVTRLQKAEKEALAELLEVRKKLQTADQRRIIETNELKRLIKNMSKGGQIAPMKPLELPSVRQKTQRKRTEESSLNTSSKLRSDSKKKTEQSKKKESKEKSLPAKKPLEKSTVPTIKDKSPQQPKKASKNEEEDYSNGGFEDQATDKNIFVKDNSVVEQPQAYEDEGYESEDNDMNDMQDTLEYIVYRLKANRMSRSKVVSLINSNAAKTVDQISQFLEKEPFGIRGVQQSEALMAALTDNHSVRDVHKVRERLISLLPSYELFEASDEQRMERHLSEVVKEYAKEINEVLSEYEDSRQRVPKSVLSNLMHELGCSASEVDYLLCKLCVQSSDLHHLNYRELSEIFAEDYDRGDFEDEALVHESVKRQQQDVDISEDGSYEQL